MTRQRMANDARHAATRGWGAVRPDSDLRSHESSLRACLQRTPEPPVV